MAFGEAGSLATNSPTEDTLITVSLTEPLTDPIIALSGTNTGGNAYVFRVVDQVLDADGNTTAFSFKIEEWEYLDGPHGAVETINWLAVEEGVHELPDGRIVEAGTTLADTSNSAVTLNGGFTDAPVVLTSVMSENDAIAVDSDPLNITSTGFDLRLQEEEAQGGGHADESVGYIAIEGGGNAANGIASVVGGVDENTDILSLGGTFTSAVTLVETQTINGGDPGNLVLVNPTNTQTGVYFQEEQSNDSETGHVNEDVGLVTFENGLLVCLATGTLVATDRGARPVEDLVRGDFLETLDHGLCPLLGVMKRRMSKEDLIANQGLRPIVIGKGALGQGLPTRDLRVSPQHRMLVTGAVARRMTARDQVLVAAKHLLPLKGVRRDDSCRPLDYFHLLFEGHEVIFAENAPTESLFIGPEVRRGLTKDAAREMNRLFPGCVLSAAYRPAARHIPTSMKQRRLVERLSRNNKTVLKDISYLHK